MRSRTLSCYDVAQYFLAQMDEDAGDLISNLKLQKLVYYAQGFALALYGRPLFPERIEAWTQRTGRAGTLSRIQTLRLRRHSLSR